MEFTVLKTKLYVSPLFFAVLTIFFIVDKNGMATDVCLCSILHELGHFLALICTKTCPKKIEITVFGIHISLFESVSTIKKIVVLIAGFSVNYILAAIFFFVEKPFLGYVNLAIGLFTAIPLSSTDGGAVLKIIFEELVPNKGETVLKIISMVTFLLMFVFLMVVAVFTKNYFIFLAIIYMAICGFKEMNDK